MLFLVLREFKRGKWEEKGQNNFASNVKKFSTKCSLKFR